ncbi:MAG: ParA family protein [bacterium]
MANALAVAMQKGGVGKTTTAINLAAGLAFEGERVLLVDLDSQGNASSGLGFEPSSLEQTVADVVLAETPPDQAVRRTGIDGLDLLPANMELSSLRQQLKAGRDDYSRLKQSLDPLQGNYDRWVFDCPPSLGPLTLSGLYAAHELLIPLQAEYYALEGLSQLWRTYQRVQENLNPALTLAGILITMYDRRTNLAEDVKDEVTEHFGDVVLDTVVPRNVRVSEAPGHGQPVLTYAPHSKGTKAYESVVKEVLNREQATTG